MKSGVQMNFLERRANADQALSQLVGMVREVTETMSSREQGGVYRLESTLLENSSATLPAAHVWIGSDLAARWMAFSTVLLALVGGLWARVRLHAQWALDRPYAQRALYRARLVCGWDIPRLLISLRVGFAAGGARLRKLRARQRVEHD
jgi:hypothetical protein